MASAFQALPPPGPPPPGVVYPTTGPTQPSAHSNGSFGMVFIVLAIILAISALACFIGRLCNKRSQSGSHQPRPNNNVHGPRFDHDNNDRMSHGLPRNGPGQRDAEFGFGPKEPGFDKGPNGRFKERDEESGFGQDEAGFDKKGPKIKIVPREEGRGLSMGSHMPRMMESPRNFR